MFRVCSVEEEFLLSGLPNQKCQSILPPLPGREEHTKASLMYISPFQSPDSSNNVSPVRSFLMTPPIALYVPLKYPFVLNSMSAVKLFSGHFTKLWSPSSYFILPKRIPRAYMLGWVRILQWMTTLVSHHEELGQRSYDALSFTALSLPPIQKRQNRNSLHHTCSRITEELASRLQGSVDSNMMLRRHKEVTGFWGVV